MEAVSLSAEHDPVAELLFPDIDKRLRNDEELKKMLFDPISILKNSILMSSENISAVSGTDTICRSLPAGQAKPRGSSRGTYYHCYNFFYEYVLRDGIQVPNTTFSTSIT